jgi:putative transposase
MGQTPYNSSRCSRWAKPRQLSEIVALTGSGYGAGLFELENQSWAPKDSACKADLASMNASRKLQVNPHLGEFRMHAASLPQGIELSPRICGRILALNWKLHGLAGPRKRPSEPRAVPIAAVRPHQYWAVDLRYLDHQFDDDNVYCISIVENHSRAIPASALSRTQDLNAFLIVLFAAVRQHGAPEALVSDNGSIFLAKQARRIYRARKIRK